MLLVPMPAPPETPVLIGWKEYLDLPDLGIRNLKIKVDTGARTSALHVDRIEPPDDDDDDRRPILHFHNLHGLGEPAQTARARVLGDLRVTDSGGHREVRPVIETTLRLGHVEKKIRLTLTNRTGMLFPMLLGRKALEGDFVVDVARKYELGMPDPEHRHRWRP